MKLTILGCNSPYPAIGEACSGYLLQDSDTSILIDCGHSVFSKLISTLEEVSKLDAILISHFHPDHYVDLYALKYFIRGALQKGLRNEPIPLLIPTQPSDIFDYWNNSNEFKVIPLDNCQGYTIKSMRIFSYAMEHPIPVWGVEVRSNNSSIFYTGDTLWNENLNLPQEVSLLLGEASFLGGQTNLAKEIGHMSTSDLAALANKISPQLLVATHLWPEFSSEQINAELKKYYPGEFAIAKSGKEFVF